MTYKARNTLILLIQVMLIAGAGAYLIFYYYPGKISVLEQEVHSLDSTLATVPEREAYLEQSRKVLEEKRAQLASFDRMVDTSVTLADAFRYLDEIQNLFGVLKFNLTTVRETKGDGYGDLEFSISGEGSFNNLFNLVWALERGPKIYVIDAINMRGVESVQPPDYKPKVVIPFDMKVRALYADIKDLPPIKRKLSQVRIPTYRNLFWPLIKKNLPPNTDNLLEAERAELRGLLPGKAIVADNMGEVHILKEGDPVYLGYLTKINQQNNTIEFTLNKGGIVERFVLELKLETGNEQNHVQ